MEPVTHRLDGGSSFIVSLRKARRSRRPRPGRTSRSRPSGSGCGAGTKRPWPSSSRWRAWLSAPVGRAARRRRCPPTRPRGSASCASGPGGVRGGSPTSPRSRGRTRPSIRFYGAAAVRAARYPSLPRSCATSGHVLATCCTWTSRSSRSSPNPGHAVTGDRTRRSRRVGWEYCHSVVDDCCRLAYRELHDDEKAVTVTAFTERALDFFLEHGVVAERLMTDNAFAYVNSRSLRELLAHRAIRSHPHQALHAAHQRQGRALPADTATRVGLRAGVRLERLPSSVAATLGRPLQRAAYPQRPRQPHPPHSRSGGHRAQQLARCSSGLRAPRSTIASNATW